MANPTTNYSFVLPTSSDLVTDLPADFDVALQGVDTRLKALQPGTTIGDLAYSSATANTNVRLGIGTSGQVLAVVAGVPAWATTADQTPLTTKGDLFTFSTVDARLAVGTNGQVLTADSSEATGLKFATPAAAAFSGVSLSKSANQSCANNATTTITFDTEQYDTDSYHSTSTNTSRITVTTAGYYSVDGQIIFAHNTSGVRQAWIAKNGNNYTMLGFNGAAGTSYASSTLSGSNILYLAASDYIEIQVSQSSGGALNALGDGDFGGSTACRFTMQKLGA